MRKQPIVSINTSKIDFAYGNCAALAISSAFGLNWMAIKTICKLLKIDYKEGMTFWECKRLINILAKSNHDRIKYHPNLAKLEYWQMITVFNRGKYIPVFDEHLSYLEEGQVYDTFLQEILLSPDGKKFLKTKPIGWWKIN